MRITSIKNTMLAVTCVVISNATFAAQAQKQMPPKFAYQYQPEHVLSKYPLGLINKQEAFAHHGGPVRKITLPNGNQGWIYMTGENLGVPELYILEFSEDDTVIDVMHKSLHYKNGHSALQYQFLHGITPELKMTGPGPGE